MASRSEDNPRLPYLPGLDGLRAVAVAAVLLYHAGVGWMPGGFLGVDVFFVLSGYLITSLLLVERGGTGRVDLARFWLRRARRLLPAALLLIAVCLLVVAVFLPGELGRARGDAIASVLYVNNWHQVFAHRSYFEAFGRPSLFQHLWSLAVEEQFYLVWPLLLTFGLARLGRTRTVAATAAMAVASALLMALLFDPSADPSRVYYGTDTRAAPLLIGALLAFAWPPGRLTARTGRGAGAVLDGLGAAGLAVLLLALTTWHDYDPWLYHGGFVVAALATAALIAAVVHPAAHGGRVLGVQPLRWIGRRSYGIYLWHWPVMALTRPGTDLRWPFALVVAFQLALSVGLAALSYRYVEMPIRRGDAHRRLAAALRDRRPRQRLALVAGAVLALLLVGGFAFGRSVPANPHRAAEEQRVASSDAAKAPRTPAADTPVHHHRRHARGEVLAVGASVMLAAEDALRRKLGPRTRVDAVVGRQPGAIIDRLEAYRRAGELPHRVVVQIGENGPLWSADAARLRAALRGVRHVVLVNVRVPRSWQAEVDDQLRQTVRGWPQATIADWLDASANPSLLYDAAHPNPAGQRIYAAVVARALRRG